MRSSGSARRVACFFLLACLFSWACWLPLALSRQGIWDQAFPPWLYLVGAWGPAFGAALMGGFPRRGTWNRLVSRRVSLAACTGLAIGIPCLVTATAATFVAWQVRAADLVITPLISVMSVLASMTIVVTGEELGWRGFALPTLQADHAEPQASLWIWWMWGTWHLPALFAALPFSTVWQPLALSVAFLVLLLPVTFVFTWLHNASGGRTWPAVMLHASIAAASASTNATALAPVSYFVVYGITFAVVALALYGLGGWGHGPQVGETD